MAINAREYIQKLDYSHRNEIPNDVLFLLPSPIILGEKGSMLRLTTLSIEQNKSFLTQIRFSIQITDSIGIRIIKNVRVIAQSDSKERIIKIETLFSETPFDSTCLVTLTTIASRFKIVDKKLEVQDSIEVSGKLLSYVHEKPRSNTIIIVAIHQKQRHEMNSHIQEYETAEDGYFKAKFSKSDLTWQDTSFWISFHSKIIEEVLIDFDYMNSHHSEKVALMAASFFDSISL